MRKRRRRRRIGGRASEGRGRGRRRRARRRPFSFKPQVDELQKLPPGEQIRHTSKKVLHYPSVGFRDICWVQSWFTFPSPKTFSSFRYVAESSEPASKKSKDSEGSTTTTGTAINQRTTTTTTTESLNTNLPSLSNQNSTRDQLKSTTTNERTSEEQAEPGLQKEAVKSAEEKGGDQKDKKVNNKEPSTLNSTFEASIKGLEEDLLKIPGTAVSLQKLFSILNNLRCKRIPTGTSKTGSCLQHSQKVRSLLNYQCLNSSAKQF